MSRTDRRGKERDESTEIISGKNDNGKSGKASSLTRSAADVKSDDKLSDDATKIELNMSMNPKSLSELLSSPTQGKAETSI